ncbi:MAG: ferritin-like domain-containing protein [Rivularia sp. (in: Bacteria)]|nr:ferritin-like domain-containing protein [Rivularia sp. MS3]
MIKILSKSHINRENNANCDTNYWQIQQNIKSLIKYYLTKEELNERLKDLPLQLQQPQPRPWKPIDWQSINCEQIIGIDLEVFLSILIGAIDTEAPIRGYTQTSRLYLQKLHPQMAQYVGGTIDDNGKLIEPGLWEKEERQHTPALIRVYQQLTGEKITPKLRTVRGYLPTNNPYEDLYRHALHRIATEFGATCLYLWLMAHTTGSLQDILEQLAIDEINHMTKFWGFGVWAYPDTSAIKITKTLIKTRHQNYKRNSLIRTLKRMMQTLQWDSWSFSNKTSLLFTFTSAIHQLWIWNNTLTPPYLNELFGDTGIHYSKSFVPNA